jgi:hypothetical protein
VFRDVAKLYEPNEGKEGIVKWRIFAVVFSLLLPMACISARGKETRATIIYDDRISEISAADEEAGQLWITTADLKRASGFELKPQGVCRDELCFPMPKSREQEFVRRRAAESWFNLVAFAQLVQQPIAHDEAFSIWYFGLRSDQRQVLSSLKAPDFTLPDMNGKTHSLSDFRGKKVLLLTWASW